MNSLTRVWILYQTCAAPCVLSLWSHQLWHPWKKQYELQNARHPPKLPLALEDINKVAQSMKAKLDKELDLCQSLLKDLQGKQVRGLNFDIGSSTSSAQSLLYHLQNLGLSIWQRSMLGLLSLPPDLMW